MTQIKEYPNKIGMKSKLERVLQGEQDISNVSFREIKEEAQKAYLDFILNNDKKSDSDGIKAAMYQIICADKLNETINLVSEKWNNNLMQGLYKQQAELYLNSDRIYWELAKSSANGDLFRFCVNKDKRIKDYLNGAINSCNEAINCGEQITNKYYYIRGYHNRAHSKKALYFSEINPSPSVIFDSLNDSLEFLKFEDNLDLNLLAEGYSNIFYFSNLMNKLKVMQGDHLKELIDLGIKSGEKGISIYREINEDSKAEKLRINLREFKRILKECNSRR